MKIGIDSLYLAISPSKNHVDVVNSGEFAISELTARKSLKYIDVLKKVVSWVSSFLYCLPYFYIFKITTFLLEMNSPNSPSIDKYIKDNKIEAGELGELGEYSVFSANFPRFRGLYSPDVHEK